MAQHQSIHSYTLMCIKYLQNSLSVPKTWELNSRMTPDTTVLHSTSLAMEGVTGEGRSHDRSVSETARNSERKNE